MENARRVDGRSLGELLKSAITSSLQLIIVVGGLVVFFNVLMELLARLRRNVRPVQHDRTAAVAGRLPA